MNKLLARYTTQDRVALHNYEILYPPSIISTERPELPPWPTGAIEEYLRQAIFPQLAPPPFGEIEIRILSPQKPVFLFLEKQQNIAVVGKLFKHSGVTVEQAWSSAEKEYFNLNLLRDRFGMNNDCCRVVAPLGKNKELSALLVTEKAAGKVLDYYIVKAIYEYRSQQLFDRLTSLAGFFAKLHHNTELDRRVSPALPQYYLVKLLDSLGEWKLDPAERATIEKYAAIWWDRDEVWTDREVIVHGDATPTNFVLTRRKVTGIDLEKMKWADRCWDLGFIAAELKHHFMWRMGDKWAAEPFIGHFLWQYAVSCKDSQVFSMLTRKVPLYMALGLLRIARNSWLNDQHRRNLISEAELCLEYGLWSSTTTTPS